MNPHRPGVWMVMSRLVYVLDKDFGSQHVVFSYGVMDRQFGSVKWRRPAYGSCLSVDGVLATGARGGPPLIDE
jgi:hypothetical protein